MRQRSCFIILLLSALLVLSANLATAKGEWGKVTVSGKGMSHVEITDAAQLQNFGLTIFQDVSLGRIDPPLVVGGGYALLRGWDNPNGTFVPFDQVHYYPDPAGGPGYVYYDGIINGSSEYDRRWFRATPQGEAAMQQLFAEHGVKPAEPGQIPAVVLNGHTASVTALAWSPDGGILASSAGDWDSSDNHVRLWSADGSLYKTLAGHRAPATSLAWSPDGTILATGSGDQTIRLWQADGHWITTLEAGKGIVFTLSWSPDGTKFASASLAGTRLNTIQIWSADGELLHTLPTQFSGGKFLNVAWSPDGAYLAGGTIDFRLWRADGTLVYSHDACEFCTPGWGLAWSPDSRLWAFGDQNGTVTVYDTDGNLVKLLHNNGNVDTLVWSPDGTILAGGNTLWKWDGEAFQWQAAIESGRVAALAWSPDGTLIASAGANRADARLWDTDGNRLANLSGHPGNINALAWSPDGSRLATAATDHTIRLWDITSVTQSD